MRHAVGTVAVAVLWQPTSPQMAAPAAVMIELAPVAAPPTPPTQKPPGPSQQAARPVERAAEQPSKPEPEVK